MGTNHNKRRHARRDDNEPEIVAALRKIGASVAKVGGADGLPDLIVGYRGLNLLLEVKVLGAGFTPAQDRWWAAPWEGQRQVVTSPAQAVAVVQHAFEIAAAGALLARER